jgi:hypothetical protein
MKAQIRSRFLTLSMILLIFPVFAGCGGGGGGGTDSSIPPSDSSALPQITGFSPTSGEVGATVTITGANFDTSTPGTSVFFMGTGAVVLDASPDQLVVTVPSGATTGPIGVITAAGANISTAVFSVIGSSGTTPEYAWIRRQSGGMLGVVAANDAGLVGFGDQYPAVSADGIDWKLQKPLWSKINDLVWGGNLYVAVGSDGVYTSPDGMAWTARLNTLPEYLNGIAWSGQLFVAVGNMGTIYTSPDGISWTLQVSGTGDGLAAVAWAGGKFVAVAEWTGNLFTSADGISWQSQAGGLSGTIAQEVAGSGDMWVVTYEDGTFFTSPDAATWTQHSLGRAAPLTQIAWSPVLSKFAAASLDGQIQTSLDGITWTAHDTPGLYDLNDIIWINDRFIAVGWNEVMSSADGENWSLLSSNNAYASVTWGGDKFVAVGTGRTIAISAEGLSWSFFRDASIPYDLTGIVWNGVCFVATGSEGLYTSSDGLYWTQTYLSDPTSKFFKAVTWSGEVFVAVGAAGQIISSPDGTSWTTHDLPVAIDLNDVAWTGNRFVVVGEQGAVYTSEDGINWTSRDSGTTEILNKVAWSGSRLVAGGDWGVLTTSVDGIAWTKLNFQFSVHPYSLITWVGDQFVAAVYTFVIGSPDGTTWSYNNIQTDASMNAAAFSPARKVLVGLGGTFYSTQ